jgi:hypothetical protein
MDPTEELLRADSVDDVDEDLWPETTLLATRWEKNDVVRRIYRSRKKLLLWGKKKENICTMETLAPNRQAVFDAFEIWAPTIPDPKSPPISWLKAEARFYQFWIVMEWLEYRISHALLH